MSDVFGNHIVGFPMKWLTFCFPLGTRPEAQGSDPGYYTQHGCCTSLDES